MTYGFQSTTPYGVSQIDENYQNYALLQSGYATNGALIYFPSVPTPLLTIQVADPTVHFCLYQMSNNYFQVDCRVGDDVIGSQHWMDSSVNLFPSGSYGFNYRVYAPFTEVVAILGKDAYGLDVYDQYGVLKFHSGRKVLNVSQQLRALAQPWTYLPGAGTALAKLHSVVWSPDIYPYVNLSATGSICSGNVWSIKYYSNNYVGLYQRPWPRYDGYDSGTKWNKPQTNIFTEG